MSPISDCSDVHAWFPLPAFNSYYSLSNPFELLKFVSFCSLSSHPSFRSLLCFQQCLIFLVFLPISLLFLWFHFSLLFLLWASPLFTYQLFSEFLYFLFILILHRDIYFFKVLFCFILKFMAQCSITVSVSFVVTLFPFFS